MRNITKNMVIALIVGLMAFSSLSEARQRYSMMDELLFDPFNPRHTRHSRFADEIERFEAKRKHAIDKFLRTYEFGQFALRHKYAMDEFNWIYKSKRSSGKLKRSDVRHEHADGSNEIYEFKGLEERHKHAMDQLKQAEDELEGAKDVRRAKDELERAEDVLKQAEDRLRVLEDKFSENPYLSERGIAHNLQKDNLYEAESDVNQAEKGLRWAERKFYEARREAFPDRDFSTRSISLPLVAID